MSLWAIYMQMAREGVQTGRPVPHGHTTHVPGCFRCELSRDEANDGLTDAIHHDREDA